MSKLTKDFILKVKDKFEELANANVEPTAEYNKLCTKYMSEQMDLDDMENDQLSIDFFAVACLSASQQPNKAIELAARLKQWGYKDVITSSQLLMYSDRLEKIESINNGIINFARQNQIDEYDIEYNVPENYAELYNEDPTNAVFTKAFLSDIMDKKDVEGEKYYEVVNYEQNANNKIPLYEGVEKELDIIKTSYSNNRSLRNDAADATKLLNLYSGLQERSEKRTWADVFKHPWNSFREWLVKGSIKKELNSRFNLSDAKIATLDNIIRKHDEVPDDYDGLKEDGGYASIYDKKEIVNEINAVNKKQNKDLSNLGFDSELDQQKGGKSSAHIDGQKLDKEKYFSQDK